MRRIYVIICILFVIGPISGQNIKLSTGVEETGAIYDTARKLVIQAYVNLGYTVEITNLPGIRSLYEVDSGKFDGELYRIAIIEKEYKNLVRVDVPLINGGVAAYTLKGKNIKIDQYNFPGLKIGTSRAFPGITIKLKVSNPPEMLYEGNEIEKVTKMLLYERVDVLVMPMILYDSFLENNNEGNIIKLSPSVEEMFLFHYVHKKNVNLKNGLEKELKKLLQQ